MRNPNADENNLTQADFWCDFCHRPWTDDAIPMIEGHRGSIVCGNCLRVAYRAMIVDEEPTPPDHGAGDEGPECVMCLERRSHREPMWGSPMFAEAWICRRCARLAAQAIEKDKTFDWRRPEKGA
jgi:hypothetical protein